jgi:hypothetical protein
MDKDNIIEDFTPYLKDCYLPIITIYNKPNDYKDMYVARLFDVKEGKVYVTKIVAVNKDLNALRKTIPDNMICIKRSDDDDKAVIESYV